LLRCGKAWPARRLGVAALQRRDHATMLVRNNHAAGLRERFALELDPSIAAPDNLQDGMNAGQQLFAGGGEQPLTASESRANGRRQQPAFVVRCRRVVRATGAPALLADLL